MYRKLNLLGLLGLSVLFIWTSRPFAQTTMSPSTTGTTTGTTTTPTTTSGGSYTTTGTTVSGSSTGSSTLGSTATAGRSSGGNFTGTSTGGGAAGRTTGTGSSTQIPTQYNTYQTYFYNPWYSGLPTKYNANAIQPARNYGQPLYAIQSATTVTTGPGVSTATTTTSGYTSQSVRRSPNYTTALSEELPIVRPTLIRANVQDIINRSTVLTSASGITVDVQGPVVVLRGEVATAKDRRIAEGMLRMTPGVLDVVNELRIK
jgi:osmotically-inducible protein OsmY